MIHAASQACHVQMQAKYDSLNPPALKELVASGAKLHRFPKEIVEAGYKEAMALYAELSSKNPNWKRVYEDYSRFLADQNLWFSFAEASMDEFMQSRR
jgi:TRAP-type mannitol/chloroaromatic compound transport system substrate-binding protein